MLRLTGRTGRGRITKTKRFHVTHARFGAGYDLLQNSAQRAPEKTSVVTPSPAI